MTTINATTNTVTTSSATTATPEASEAAVISSDFETFLVMLTAQIENQDPLNPMDSSDYAVQLATFSSVEQQVLTNQLLSEGGLGDSLNGLGDVAGWVGMEARHDGPVASGEAPVTLHLDLPAGSTSHELVVKSTAGLEITRTDVTNASTPFTWNATASDGSPLLDGNYQLEVVSTNATGSQTTTAVETYAAIREARISNGAPEIILANGAALNTAQITGLRTATQDAI